VDDLAGGFMADRRDAIGFALDTADLDVGQSLPQMPQAFTLTTTSLLPGWAVQPDPADVIDTVNVEDAHAFVPATPAYGRTM